MSESQDIRLSISEAAKLFGVNAQTIRRAIKAGDLSYILVQDRYKITFESLVQWSQRHTSINNKMESRGIGQYVNQWKIRNTTFVATPDLIAKPKKEYENQPSLLALNEPEIELEPTPEPEAIKIDPPLTNPTLPF